MEPVAEFLENQQPKHRAKVLLAIDRIREFGPHLPFPHSSHVKDSEFRELRTSFAGQQFRVLYIRDGDEFVLFEAFHKTSHADLGKALRGAERYLEDYRKE
ncbi:MAG: type II toxin-antitoxin system RelE/ParE family toxin [Gaiellaceae bacterium]